MPTLREDANVLLPGTKEIQKVQAQVFAGFAEAQKNQVVPDAFFGGNSRYDMPKRSERFNGVLCVVVVPRYAVEAQEREKFVSEFLS